MHEKQFHSFPWSIESIESYVQVYSEFSQRYKGKWTNKMRNFTQVVRLTSKIERHWKTIARQSKRDTQKKNGEFHKNSAKNSMKSIHHGNRDETTFVLLCGFCSLEHAVQIKKLFAVRWNVGEKSCVCCCCFSAFVMYGRIQGIINFCFNETIHNIKIKSTFLQRNSLKNSSHRRLSYTRKKNQLWNWRNLAFHEMVNSVFFYLYLCLGEFCQLLGEKNV